MNVRLQYTTGFTAGIFYANELRMNNYHIRLSLTTITEDGNDHNVALDRVKYFIHNQLAHSVFINGTDSEHCQSLSAAGVRITNLPDEPVDQIVGIMLYCKLNAVMEDRMVITEIEFSSDLGDNVVYLHNSEEAQGPFVDTGWWNESDTSHCDISIDQSKVVTINQGDSWRGAGLNWSDETVTTVFNSDNKVLFADFAKDETK